MKMIIIRTKSDVMKGVDECSGMVKKVKRKNYESVEMVKTCKLRMKKKIRLPSNYKCVSKPWIKEQKNTLYGTTARFGRQKRVREKSTRELPKIK